MKGLKMNFLFVTILTIAILYAWAGLIFAFLCLRYERSENGQRRFLETYSRYFTQGIIKTVYVEITPKALRDKGATGWGMLGLPMIVLYWGFTFWNAIFSVFLLFIGGFVFAQAWYGLRCLRCLGLDSFSKDGPNESAVEKPDPASS